MAIFDGRPLGEPGRLGSSATANRNLEPEPLAGSDHGVCRDRPASILASQAYNIAAVVECFPISLAVLSRGKGQTMRMVMRFARPILAVDVIQGQGPARLPFSPPAPNPHPDRFGFHLADVCFDCFLEDDPSNFRVILEGHRNFGGQGDDAFLRGAERATALG